MKNFIASVFSLILIFGFNLQNSAAHFIPFFQGCDNCPKQTVNDDPVLFIVNGKEVRLSEFTYIYNKTNGDKADYSEKSLNEYLQLYIDFKLQVAKGVELGLDKNEEVIREQNQYKKQLSSSYLTDREITERLVKEAYEWSKEDRKFSHILVKINENSSEEDVKKAYGRALSVKKQVNADNFLDMVKQYSEDSYSNKNGGDMGYFTALMLPYEIEKALYTTSLGAVSNVIRSKYGFHILKVTDVRPAYGQVQLAQILVRGDDARAKNMIDSLYNLIKSSDVFDELATKYSEDNSTKSKAGIIGWIGINKFPADFEKVIFELSKDGAISAPVKTSAGWHILKRVKAMKNPSYQEIKGELTNKIKQNERYQIILDSLTAKIKREANYSLNNTIMAEIIDSLKKDPTFIQGRWNPSNSLMNDDRVLFTVGDRKGTVKEFATMGQRSPNERFSANPRTFEGAAERVLNKLVSQKCLEFEETQLDKKYPEFKSLLREYEEGILLFEVKKQLIWDKASSDEEGLTKFYNANKGKYQWRDRAKVTTYTVRSADKKLTDKIKKSAKKLNADALKELYNKDNAILQSTEAIYEKGKNKELDDLKWKPGTVSNGYVKEGSFYFTKIESVNPATNKTLDEARGYIVADYQDELEKNLIKGLRESFKVEVKQDVFKGLIKKK
jgi:peptidyl-prolyl cis-trans isomerase SurA